MGVDPRACLTGRPKGERPEQPERKDEPSATVADAGGLLCAACGALVTDRRFRVEVQGSHGHRFMNPAGFLFHVGCFAEAVGCVVVGPDSPEYPWFVGYLWSIAQCASCGQHLGWRFRARDAAGPDGGSFFGLIVDRLREAPGGDSSPPS